MRALREDLEMGVTLWEVRSVRGARRTAAAGRGERMAGESKLCAHSNLVMVEIDNLGHFGQRGGPTLKRSKLPNHCN